MSIHSFGKYLANDCRRSSDDSLVKQLDKIWDFTKDPFSFGGGFGFLLILTFFVKFTYLSLPILLASCLPALQPLL